MQDTSCRIFKVLSFVFYLKNERYCIANLEYFFFGFTFWFYFALRFFTRFLRWNEKKIELDTLMFIFSFLNFLNFELKSKMKTIEKQKKGSEITVFSLFVI